MCTGTLFVFLLYNFCIGYWTCVEEPEAGLAGSCVHCYLFLGWYCSFGSFSLSSYTIKRFSSLKSEVSSFGCVHTGESEFKQCMRVKLTCNIHQHT